MRVMVLSYESLLGASSAKGRFGMESLEKLSLVEEEENGLIFHVKEELENQANVSLCLVGRFLMERTIKTNVMKDRMARI